MTMVTIDEPDGPSCGGRTLSQPDPAGQLVDSQTDQTVKLAQPRPSQALVW